MSELVTLAGGTSWTVGDTRFEFTYDKNSSVDRFDLRKPPNLVARYADLCRTFQGGAIMELGIAAGGSTALLALLAQPRKLVAVEFEPEPVAALSQLIDRKSLNATVHPYYGVDQSDRVRLREILELEFGEAPIDLVIDDASHLYAETRTSFELLFPRLRPGGLFIIEDWSADHMRSKWVTAALEREEGLGADLARPFVEALARREQGLGPFPLHRLGPEFMQVCLRQDVIDEITVNSHWVTVRRGHAELDTTNFRLADHHDPDWQWVLD